MKIINSRLTFGCEHHQTRPQWIALTGPLWIFIVPPVSLYIHGLKRGLINIFIFVLISCLIMFWPQNIYTHAVYPTEFKLRLHNRRNAQDILNQYISAADVSAPFSVLLCDIDYFKQVNDKYGHNAGISY